MEQLRKQTSLKPPITEMDGNGGVFLVIFGLDEFPGRIFRFFRKNSRKMLCLIYIRSFDFTYFHGGSLCWKSWRLLVFYPGKSVRGPAPPAQVGLAAVVTGDEDVKMCSKVFPK